MVDIMTALTTVSQAIKLTQDLRGVDKAIDAAEYKLKIADLTTALADLKIALTDAKEELSAKDREIAALKKQFQRVGEMVESKGFKYDRDPFGQPKGKAYCPVCEQKCGQFYHLTRLPVKGDTCPNRKTNYDLVMIYKE